MKFLSTILFLYSFANGLVLKAQTSNAFQILLEKSKLTGFPDSSTYYAKQALELSNLNKNKTENGLAICQLVRSSISQADFTKAREFLDIGFLRAKQNNDKAMEYALLVDKGKIYQLENKHDEALKLYLIALDFFESSNDLENEVRTNIYLAEYYRNISKFKEATNHINKAFSLTKKQAVNDLLQIKLYNRAAAIKSETSDGDSSLYFSNLALQLSKKTKNINQQAVSLNEIGFIKESKFLFKEALQYYSEAELIWSQMNSERDLVNVLENKARTYSRMGNTILSNQIYLKVLEIAEKNNWQSNIASVCLVLQWNYIKLGKKNLAYFYEAKSLRAQLETFKLEHKKEIELTTAKYNSEKKEAELKKQKEEIEIANLKYESQKNHTTTLIYGISALALLMVLITYIAFQRSKGNKELKEKNKEIEDSNLKLNESLKKTEILLQEVHHRVKNNLQFISSIIELEIDSNKNSKKEGTLEDMSRRITAMSLVHELLYNQDNLEKVPMKKYINELMLLLNDMVNNKNLVVKFELSIDEIMLDVKQCVAIGMILSELVSNSIKHAFAKQNNPIISIELKNISNKKITRIVVCDNGSGYNNHEPKKGMGTRLVHIFTTQLNGKYTLATDKSFSFIFEFPSL